MGGMFSDLKKLEQAPTAPVSNTRIAGNTGTRKPGNTATQQPGNTATQQPGNTGGSARTAEHFDINRPATEKETFLFTTEEVDALEDIKFELRRKLDLPTSKQDIARCGVQFLARDYEINGAKSILVQLLQTKHTK